jgi:hypothetical protein
VIRLDARLPSRAVATSLSPASTPAVEVVTDAGFLIVTDDGRIVILG